MGFESTGYLYGLKLTLACLLIPILFLLFLLALVPVVCYRWLLCRLQARLRPDLTGLVRHHSPGIVSLMTLGLPKSSLNVVVRLKLEGPADVSGIKDVFKQKFADPTVYPELRSYFYLWGGYWFWKPDPDFHIDHHVMVNDRRLRGPGEIDAVQAKWLDSPLPAKRALWQVLVCEEVAGSDPHAHCHYLLIKFHHALADGFSILQGLVKVTDEESKVGLKSHPKIPAQSSTVRGRLPVSFLWRLLNALSVPFRCIMELAHLICTGWPTLPWTKPPRGDGYEKPEFTARRCHIAVSGRRLDVGRIKSVAREHSVTFTAAQLAALTGGIREFLLTSRGYKAQELPKEIVYPCPVPMLNHPPGMNNYFYVVTLRLPIGCPNRSKRLQRIEAMLQDRKRSLEPLVTCTLASLFSLLPAACFRIPFIIGFMMTNFPGPLTPVRINGTRVVDMNTSLIAQCMGLYVGFLSYNGSMAYTFTGEKTLFPGGTAELVRLGEHVADELEALEGLDIEVLDCN